MSFVADIPELEGGLGDVLSLLGIAQNESLSEQISKLYSEADALAVFTVKVTVALFWWASHMASATADALGYSAQMQAEMAEANKYELETWTQFLRVKHPAEIRRVYIRTTKRIQVVKKIIQRQQEVNLSAIRRELAELERWKKKTVTPELKQWLTFYANWKKTYRAPLHTLIRWQHKPETLVLFILGPLISAMPSGLRKATAKRSATAIEAALLATWVNDPDTVYSSVLDWLVTG